MDRYLAHGYSLPIAATVTKTALTVTGQTTVRARFYEALLSFAVPADDQNLVEIGRVADFGTGTGGLPGVKTDLDSPAATCIYYYVHTVEPSYLGSGNDPIQQYLNARSMFHWVAAPGSEILIPATADYGLGCRSTTATAGTTNNLQASLYWEE